MTRKINLGKYAAHYQYESVDIAVTDCESKEEAMKEVREWEEELKAKLGKTLTKKKETEAKPF